MGEFVLPPVLASMADLNRITSDDVLELRQNVYVDGLTSAEDAVAILALDTTCRNKCEEWNGFFRQALSEFIVLRTEPANHLSEKNARWLISAVSRDGCVASRTEMLMMIDALGRAQTAPAFFSGFLLKQVADAVISGKGPLMKNRVARRSVITRDDVEMIRSIILSNGADEPRAVSKEEAEVLFILNDRSIEAQNDPAWNDLFVKALANFMMGMSGYSVPKRRDALERGEWLDDMEANAARSTFERMVGDGLKSVLPLYLETSEIHSVYNRRSQARLEEDRKNGLNNGGEAHWLAARVGRDGYMRQNEKALLAALKSENAVMHPDLEPLLARVA